MFCNVTYLLWANTPQLHALLIISSISGSFKHLQLKLTSPKVLLINFENVSIWMISLCPLPCQHMPIKSAKKLWSTEIRRAVCRIVMRKDPSTLGWSFWEKKLFEALWIALNMWKREHVVNTDRLKPIFKK